MNSNILQQYTVIVEFLGKALGPDYEVVLHDLSSKDLAITAIANGHISGRKAGGPLTDAALRMLSSRAYETDDYLCNYKGIAQNGHVLRSSPCSSGTRMGSLSDFCALILTITIIKSLWRNCFPRYIPMPFSNSIRPAAAPYWKSLLPRRRFPLRSRKTFLWTSRR